MSRPIKCRKVKFLPNIACFMPEGGGQGETKEIILKLEELEAIRLKDLAGLSQQECADIMEVSRQTFQNILGRARKKVSMALIKGLPLQIRGGDFAFEFCQFKCNSCNCSYKIHFKRDRFRCPLCQSEKIVCCNKNNKCNRYCER